jgi:hypothetical protein
MAHAGRQWARENATLEAMVRGLDAVYGALA